MWVGLGSIRLVVYCGLAVWPPFYCGLAVWPPLLGLALPVIPTIIPIVVASPLLRASCGEGGAGVRILTHGVAHVIVMSPSADESTSLGLVPPSILIGLALPVDPVTL